MAREREKDFGICRCCVARDVCKRKMCDIISLAVNGRKMNEKGKKK